MLSFCAALSAGCAAPTTAERQLSATPAVDALRRGDFTEAELRARESLAADHANPQALLVRAIVRYQKTMRHLALGTRTLVVGGLEAGGFDDRYLRTTFEQGEAELAAVADDLAAVGSSRGVALELCLACWENVDWNGDGRIDRRDRLLLQIERDAQGEPIPEGDPRRKPTFRFDDGDVAWARAFVGFERAALDVVLAYDWSGIDEILAERRAKPEKIVVHLVHRDRIASARERILEGLTHSDEARRAYLAETDDDREWVPSPQQKNHPMPLPVDQALYDTWAGALGDLRQLALGNEGLGVVDLARLADAGRELRGARGYIDVGRMLSHPKDITIDVGQLRGFERKDADAVLSSLLGEYYVREMKPSPLPARLLRMKGEIDAHHEDLEHKLRYLFWLN
jgi:hypothetical protein